MKIIRNTMVCFVFSITTCLLFADALGAWPEGPPAYRTGAIGDKGTCHADECHNSYSLNSGNAKFSIIVPTIYTAGKSVKIEVSFSNTQGIAYGFEMTADDANGKRVGKFKKIGNITQVIPPNDYRGLKKEDKGKYIEHTSKGIKKKQWKFKWVAPRSAADPITFYAAGVEAIVSDSLVKDYVYTTTSNIIAGSSAP